MGTDQLVNSVMGSQEYFPHPTIQTPLKTSKKAIHAQRRHHFLIFLKYTECDFLFLKSPSSKLSNVILNAYLPLSSLGYIGASFCNCVSSDRLPQ